MMNIQVGYDFAIFLEAARCFLAGQSPYLCSEGWYYPIPAIFIFLPFTLIPAQLAFIIWSFLSLAALVYVLKRRALWFILFIPAPQVIFQGQVDLVMLPALAAGGPVGMAIMTLKPQLVALFLPFWWFRSSPQDRRRFAVVALALWGIPTVFYPSWPIEFLSKLGQGGSYAAPSLISGGVPLFAGLVIGVLLLWLSRDKFAATLAVNPAIKIYDLSMLMVKAPWWIVPLSWLTFYLNNRLGNSWSGVMLSFAVAVSAIDFVDLSSQIHAINRGIARRIKSLLPETNHI